MDNFKVIGNVVGVPNPKTDTYSKTEINDMLSTNADKLNSLKYYGDINIVPSDASLFTFTTDDETMTASVSAASKDISGDIVIPYQYVADDKVYLVTKVRNIAFNQCNNITNITIPCSVTIIGDNAFGGCDGLTSVTITGGVTSINAWAFNCSNIRTITIPDSVTAIGKGAFYGCNYFTDVYYEGTKEEWDDIDIDMSYDTTLDTIIVHYADELWTRLMSLQSYGDCITVPSDASLFEFGEVLHPLEGGGSTRACTVKAASKQLSGSIVIPFGVYHSGARLKLTCIGNSTSSTNNAGDHLTGAFEGCSNITNLKIPNTVETICASAFQDCSSVTKIHIPATVTKIYENAFLGCDSLETVYYGGTESQWKKIRIDNGNDLLKNAQIRYNLYDMDVNSVVNMIGDLEKHIDENYVKKEEVDAEIGDIETALDNIIAIQNTLIGGESV